MESAYLNLPTGPTNSLSVTNRCSTETDRRNTNMTITTVRTNQTFQAIHFHDPEFETVLNEWVKDDSEAAAQLLSMAKEAPAAQKPWLVSNGDAVGFVTPANFVNDFEDVFASSTLDDVWRERRRHVEELGYNAEHDDNGTMGHLPSQIQDHLYYITQNSLTDAERRKELIQIAALATAAVDRLDRAQTVRTFSVD